MSILENIGKVLLKPGSTNPHVNKEDLKLDKTKLQDNSLDPLNLWDPSLEEPLSDITDLSSWAK